MAKIENDKTYKWAYPSDWLSEKVDEACARGDVTELRSIINTMMSKLAEDDIQDEFQPEMDRDGYFQPEGTDDEQDDE